ncbi:tmbim6 [Symbiodinium sp. KB8]|nr:tmbim6 [Symbiodinium sp. KB8]
MDTLGAAFNGKLDLQALLKAGDISAGTQDHLARVYLTLCIGLAASSVGAYVHMLTHMGGMLSSLAALGLTLWLAFDADKTNTLKRVSIFTAFCFAKGMSVGPLVAYAAYVEPSIILTAFLGTATIFGAFSLSAMLSKRRSLLYIGAISSSILSMLLLGSLLSFFLPWQVFTELNLYLGLAAFMGYVVYDTQVIIERSEALGDAPKDIAMDALQLFVDFLGIFVRLLIILARNSRKKQGSQGGSKRRERS